MTLHCTASTLHRSPSREPLVRRRSVAGGRVSRYPPALRKSSPSAACQRGGIKSFKAQRVSCSGSTYAVPKKICPLKVPEERHTSRARFYVEVKPSKPETVTIHRKSTVDMVCTKNLRTVPRHQLATPSTDKVMSRKACPISSTTALPLMSTSQGRAGNAYLSGEFCSRIRPRCRRFTTTSLGQNCTTFVYCPRRPGGTTMVNPSSRVPLCAWCTLSIFGFNKSMGRQLLIRMQAVAKELNPRIFIRTHTLGGPHETAAKATTTVEAAATRTETPSAS